MNNQSSSSNPYTSGEAVYNSAMFFGRADILSWIKDNLKHREGQQSLRQPLVLHGPPGVGKTSILNQLKSGFLGERTAVILIDFPALSLDSLNEFLWDLAAIINEQTAPTDTEILVPLVEKSHFTDDPGQAFMEGLNRVAEERLDGHRLLLAFDDLDILVDQAQEGFLEYTILNYLHELLQRYEYLDYIFTLSSPVENLPGEALAPFNLLRRYPVNFFDLETTLALLRQPASLYTSNVVGTYIFNLTGGHPGDIQRFCYALYERQQKYQLAQITLADVVAVARQPDSNNGFQTPVHKRRAEQPVTIVPGVSPNHIKPATTSLSRPSVVKPFPAARRSGKRIRGWYLLALFLIIFFIGGGFVLSARLARSMGGPAADLPATTAAPTQTPAAEETAVVLVAAATPTARPSRTAAPTQTAAPTASQTPAETATSVPASPTRPPATPTRTPTPEPTSFPGSEDIPAVITREADNMPMLVIPSGTFIMGAPESDPSAADDEFPEHEVTIDTFYMDKFEVTVSQYAAFLNTLETYRGACENIDCAWPRQLIGYTSYLLEIGEEELVAYEAMEGFENYPINHVSWYGANAYCQAVGARLPTEAEWEYAARGTDGRIYPWGNEPPDWTRAVFFSSAYSDLKPVDALPDGASPFGIFGLAGSMWEWVADWYGYDYYQNSPAENPQGPEDGEGKVVRGGAWPNNNQADRLRSANRNSREPSFFSPDLGFRCAYTLPE